METMTMYEARTDFGDTLMKAQRAPVQITKNAEPVAVLISMRDYAAMEELKLRYVKDKLERARDDIKNGRTVDSEELFDDLIAGKYD